MLIEFPRALPVPASTGIFEHIWRGTSAWRSNPAGYSRCVYLHVAPAHRRGYRACLCMPNGRFIVAESPIQRPVMTGQGLPDRKH